MPRALWRICGCCLAAVCLTACGDAPTADDRGYTKAPLETPGIVITPETRADVRQFMRLNQPDGLPVILPDSAAGGG